MWSDKGRRERQRKRHNNIFIHQDNAGEGQNLECVKLYGANDIAVTTVQRTNRGDLTLRGESIESIIE